MKGWSIEFTDKNGELITGTLSLDICAVVSIVLDYLGVDFVVYHNGEQVVKKNTTQ